MDEWEVPGRKEGRNNRDRSDRCLIVNAQSIMEVISGRNKRDRSDRCLTVNAQSIGGYIRKE